MAAFSLTALLQIYHVLDPFVRVHMGSELVSTEPQALNIYLVFSDYDGTVKARALALTGYNLDVTLL